MSRVTAPRSGKVRPPRCSPTPSLPSPSEPRPYRPCPEPPCSPWTRDLRLLLADGPALRRHGYDPATLAGRPLADVAPAHSYAELEPHYRAALAGEPQTFEHSSSDATAWYLTHIAPLTEGEEIVGAVAISQDITSRRVADDELRAVTTLFETAFAAAPIGMALVGVDG